MDNKIDSNDSGNVQVANNQKVEYFRSFEPVGITSVALGAISLMPFLGVISLFGLVVGVVGLILAKDRFFSVIGVAISAVGVITSPVLWAGIFCLFFECLDGSLDFGLFYYVITS